MYDCIVTKALKKKVQILSLFIVLNGMVTCSRALINALEAKLDRTTCRIQKKKKWGLLGGLTELALLSIVLPFRKASSKFNYASTKSILYYLGTK